MLGLDRLGPERLAGGLLQLLDLGPLGAFGAGALEDVGEGFVGGVTAGVGGAFDQAEHGVHDPAHAGQSLDPAATNREPVTLPRRHNARTIAPLGLPEPPWTTRGSGSFTQG